MFGTIRRHQSWLLFVIVALTIVSFLFLGPTNTRMGDSLTGIFSRNTGLGTLAGKPISETELRNTLHEVALGGFFKTQQWPDLDSFEIRHEAYLRLFLIQKQKELGIEISTEAVAAEYRKMAGTAPLDIFSEKILKPNGLNSSDLENFLRHQLGIEQLIRTAGMTGALVTPQEGDTMFRLENQEFATEMVHFQATNYFSRVPVTPQTLGQFYSNQLANYRVPEKVQVQYVKFNLSNYFGEVLPRMTNETAINQYIDAYTREYLGTNLFPHTQTIDESRAAIRMTMVKTNANIYALRAASKFTEDLDAESSHTLETFHRLAATNGLKVENLEPFGSEYGPEDLDVPPTFARSAFSLSSNTMFSGFISAVDGVYVLAFQKRIPSHTPTLQEIEPKVTEDFREMNAIQMAQQDCIQLAARLNDPTNGLASGKLFATFCSEAGAKITKLPPFSATTRSLPPEIEHDIDLNSLKQLAMNTPPGKASSPAQARDGAFILYVVRTLPIDEAKVKTDLPAFLTYVRQARQNDAFNQWFNLQARLDPAFVQFVQQMTEQSRGATARRRPGS